LFRREPVPETDPESSDAFHAPDAGSQFGAEQAGVRGLVRDAPDSREPKVDRGRSVLPLFKMNAVAEDDRPIERQARL
jgi:hypothetical protein